MRLGVRAILLMAVVVAVVVLYVRYFGTRTLHFAEEVQLADGELLVVDRVVKAEPLGEIGGPGGWESAYTSFEILTPSRPGNPPKWESRADLAPILFDKDPDNGEWTLLATFYTCEAWDDLGRPQLPYVEFRLRNRQWQQTKLSEKWIGRAANVLTDVRSDGEPSRIGLYRKRQRMSDTMIAERFRVIVGKWIKNC